jgi:hypothetical protein
VKMTARAVPVTTARFPAREALDDIIGDPGNGLWELAT